MKVRLQSSRKSCRKTLLQEFIGKEIEIIKSSDPTLIGIKGIVVWETKNTFHLLTKSKKIIIVPKIKIIFKFNDCIILGASIMYRPEERIKKIRR